LCFLALVKNNVCVVCAPATALANVGVTAVTTVAPGCPLTTYMTFAKVDVTPGTQVAADAEDDSTALRLLMMSAARSVWFEAEANSTSRTAARRDTIARFGLVISSPPSSTTTPFSSILTARRGP
jgi:hypothetical protein